MPIVLDTTHLTGKIGYNRVNNKKYKPYLKG